jgi:flagellar hook-length control protein FliK
VAALIDATANILPAPANVPADVVFATAETVATPAAAAGQAAALATAVTKIKQPDAAASKTAAKPTEGVKTAATTTAENTIDPQALDPAAAAPADGKPQGTPDNGKGTPVHAHDAQPTAQPATDAAAITTDASAAVAKAASAAQPITAAQQLPQAAAAPQAAPASAPAQQDAAIPIAGVAVEIASKALAGKNRFEIRLDPPDLGRIDVRLDVDKSGRVTSYLTVERADTLDLLRRDSAGLERTLQDAGLKTSDNGLQFSLRDQSMSQQQSNTPTPAAAQIFVEDDTLPAAAAPRNYARFAGMGSGVDIRV